MTSPSPELLKQAKIIAIRALSNDALMELSARGMLSLSLDEIKTIQSHFKKLDREPTDIELETLAQTWSEHCVHKTFKASVNYSEVQVGETKSLPSKSYGNLLKETIVKATEELNPPWCLSVFKDNAGVIDFDQTDAVSFKVETHNHPSALEPYGGAGTGVGGVIRDVLGCGLGGKPVLNTDVFCFGDLNTPQNKIPKGALSPKRIAKGVVAGVRDYGNRMGIPTANGAIYFDPGYVGNPLVFCGTVGIMPKDCIEKTVMPGDLVVVMGGRTGRDGIHGATFSSAPLTSGMTSSVVQIGHAIMEKKTMDVLLQARNKRLYRSVTDCGAGGFSSAIGELGSETGVEVWLDKAPLKYPGLEAWEIWVSESQERMVLAVPAENWNSLSILCRSEDVEAVVVGKFTDDKKLRIQFDGEMVGELDMHFLHDGIPKPHLNATWDAIEHRRKYDEATNVNTSLKSNAAETLKALLQHPIIASKESVVRQYDHEVQGGSIIKPFMGAFADGPTDACVFRPKLSSWRGVAISNGMNPEVGKWDPYVMAHMAIDEALRNLVAVGGGLNHVAILDNFCWGNPKSDNEIAALVRAAEACREAAVFYGLPFISGKDSFNNTWKSDDGRLHSIPPTLLISAIGILDDVRQCVSPGLKDVGNLIYLVGETTDRTTGALVNQLWKENGNGLPQVDFVNAKANYKKLESAMKHRVVSSCHDLSEGGLAVSAAEMAFGSALGIELDLSSITMDPSTFLFSETPSRFLVEIRPEHKSEFEQSLGLRMATQIGKVIAQPQMIVKKNNAVFIQESVAALKTLWKKTLEHM